jgi:3-hydroxyacyl-CoA dehydrogenase/enoyl-CoA hydratase/3-hydroxybutyryl-CoA epimerase
MSDAIQLDVAANGLGTLTFDLKEEKVNKLSYAIMMELKAHITALSKRDDVKVLVIKSGKPGVFIAGADITEFQSVDTPQKSREVVDMGQSIFNMVSVLPFPTIAAIQGVCLGGGLELALACDFRVCSDSQRAMLGLPEVNLGIIPGWGGTQRLPRLIGMTAALDIILKGGSIPGPKALKLGLVDLCVPDDFFEERLRQFTGLVADEAKRKQLLKRRKSPSWLDSFFLHRWLVGYFAKKTVMAKSKGQYPAPLAAINAVVKGYGASLKKGLEEEAKAFIPLPLTSVSKHLVTLFFIQESLKKYTGVNDASIKPKRINSAAVLGAGLMGGGIAWLFSYRDIQVRLKDIAWGAVAKGYEAAYAVYKQLLKKRRLTPSQVSQKLLKIAGTTSYHGFKKTDVVVEAIVENMDVKKQVFQALESEVNSETIIATNTSSLSVTEMATVLTRPENFVGMHFFSPVNRMPLVEVIPGEKTSDQTVATIVDLSKKLKKTPIVVKNCPGFLVNRILIPYVNEAVSCLQDGAKVKEIDDLLEAFGMPIGPFALADEVGLDVGYKVAKVLEEGYGDRMAVSPVFDAIYEKEHLRGKKSGAGFYTHTGNKKQVNAEVQAIVANFKGANSRLSKEDILDRLILIMVNEAAKCLEESVVASHELLDMAMLLGTGFPPFRGGLCAYADEIGIQTCVDKLNRLSDLYGSRFKPSSLLVQLSKEQSTFYTR